MVCFPWYCNNFRCKGRGCRGVSLEIRMGDRTISVSDLRMKIEEHALFAKKQLLINDRKRPLFMEVEPTVTKLMHFRGNKVLRKGICEKQFLHSVKQLLCIFTLYSEELSRFECVRVLYRWCLNGEGICHSRLFLHFLLCFHEEKTAKLNMTAQAPLYNV